MSYTGLGQPCPGQEVWDASIAACTCPSGMKTTGIVGECIPMSKPDVPYAELCPPYTSIPEGVSCWCLAGHAFDPRTRMCTKEAFGPQSFPKSAPPTAFPPQPTEPVAAGVAGLNVGVIAIAAVAAGVLSYLVGQS